jgi:transcriptional regulator with XRE-family HTH domain
MKFADRMRELRKEQGLTQDDLAKALGISRSAVGMYEQGRREPDFDILDTAADFFDVSVGYMTGGPDRGSYPRILTAYEKALKEQRKPRAIGVTLEEERLIKAYREAGPDVRQAVKAVLRIKA